MLSERKNTREDQGRERIAHPRAYSDENYLKSSFGSVSHLISQLE